MLVLGYFHQDIPHTWVDTGQGTVFSHLANFSKDLEHFVFEGDVGTRAIILAVGPEVGQVDVIQGISSSGKERTV